MEENPLQQLGMEIIHYVYVYQCAEQLKECHSKGRSFIECHSKSKSFKECHSKGKSFIECHSKGKFNYEVYLKCFHLAI